MLCPRRAPGLTEACAAPVQGVVLGSNAGAVVVQMREQALGTHVFDPQSLGPVRPPRKGHTPVIVVDGAWLVAVPVSETT